MAHATLGKVEDDRIGGRIVADLADELDRPAGTRRGRATRAAVPAAAMTPSDSRPMGQPMTTIIW